jgi:hypothetical protein
LGSELDPTWADWGGTKEGENRDVTDVESGCLPPLVVMGVNFDGLLLACCGRLTLTYFDYVSGLPDRLRLNGLRFDGLRLVSFGLLSLGLLSLGLLSFGLVSFRLNEFRLCVRVLGTSLP